MIEHNRGIDPSAALFALGIVAMTVGLPFLIAVGFLVFR